MKNKSILLGQSNGAMRNKPLTEIPEMFSQLIQLPEAQYGRKRLFSPQRTFWLFLSQVIAKSASCRETVRKFLVWLAAEKGAVASPGTAAYCKARARLGQKFLKTINRQVVANALAMACRQRRRFGGQRLLR
ncbi:MAG: transposase domain-containing protein [Proteobacteria bacterium]|nr:transposase domain-containing protein [Pseudomonadota bacterium]